MRIVAADIYDVDLHDRMPPIILRLITDEGLYGLGEFAMGYGTGRRAAIGMLKDMVEGFVLGADPTLVEKDVAHPLPAHLLGPGRRADRLWRHERYR